MYKKPCALLVLFENDYPVFGELSEVLIIGGDPFLHLQIRETVFYSEHYHCFVLGRKRHYVTMHQSELLCHHPLHIRCIQGLTSYGQSAVVPKCHISTL